MPKQSSFSKSLLNWHQSIDRKLPWKEDRDPYKIWLSEIIMQQTRVAQGTPYYLKFVGAFPTIVDLADADEDTIMKLWQGLGYYSRARNLHHAAKTVRDEFGGVFPTEYDDVLSLKGVGKYTAAAIVSFAYGEEKAVVDGNVIRVLARYFGITDAVDHSATLKMINQKASQLIQGSDPGAYNQAIMDFGALHCTPKSPSCQECVFSDKCVANNQGTVSKIPYKAKKIKKRTRYLHYFIIEDKDGNTILKFRNEKDIWQSLYDYPCMENVSPNQVKEKEVSNYLRHEFGLVSKSILFPIKNYKHILTHQTIFASFYKVSVDKINDLQSPFIRIPIHKKEDYALPVLLTNQLNDTTTPTLFD